MAVLQSVWLSAVRIYVVRFHLVLDLYLRFGTEARTSTEPFYSMFSVEFAS